MRPNGGPTAARRRQAIVWLFVFIALVTLAHHFGVHERVLELELAENWTVKEWSSTVVENAREWGLRKGQGGDDEGVGGEVAFSPYLDAGDKSPDEEAPGTAASKDTTDEGIDGDNSDDTVIVSKDQGVAEAVEDDRVLVDVEGARTSIATSSSNSIDDDDCGAASCRFLWPIHIREQETKGSSHLYQLGALALILNRTLVLPHAQYSYFRACWDRPFSFYYDDTWLPSLGIPTISQNELISWARSRSQPPSTQYVSVIVDSYDPEMVTVSDRTKPRKFPFKNCVPEDVFDISNHYHLNFTYSNPRERVTPPLRRFVDALETGLGAKEGDLADVLAVQYDLRAPIFNERVFHALAPDIPAPAPYTKLPYAKQWRDLADEIVQKLSPFVVIQWRTESVNPLHLSPCVDSLIETMKKIKLEHPEIQTAYIATDYPLESLQGIAQNHPHSGTYRVKRPHHRAFQKLLDNFNEDDLGLRLTSYVMEEKDLDVPGGESLMDVDVSLIGMIDKRVAMQAELFVAGQPGSRQGLSCGRRSSYTTSILDGRDRQPEGALWNRVETFGLPEGSGFQDRRLRRGLLGL